MRNRSPFDQPGLLPVGYYLTVLPAANDESFGAKGGELASHLRAEAAGGLYVPVTRKVSLTDDTKGGTE